MANRKNRASSSRRTGKEPSSAKFRVTIRPATTTTGEVAGIHDCLRPAFEPICYFSWMAGKNNAPRLKTIALLRDRVQNWEEYPFNIPVVRNLQEINLRSRVCFFVGENGTGKSTLLEAIADHCGYGRQGGSRNMSGGEPDRSTRLLSRSLRLSWSNKIMRGFFLRAESFFNIATYLDEQPELLQAYGGKPLHQQSHGESFLALFENRFFRKGFYLLDEPEAALSPQRQLTFLLLLHGLLRDNDDIQFIIASHSPIILSYPNSQIFSFNDGELRETEYEATDPYRILSGFLKSPERYLKRLLEE
jgi:predicted ATPase